MITIPSPWRPALLALFLAWGVLAALYYSTGAVVVDIWNRSQTFAHAWVVPPISAWLVWRMRADLAGMVPRAAPLWLLALVPLGLLWIVGDIASVNAATHFALMGMVVVLVPAMLGTAPARRMTFPLGFLFFAVPFGEFLTPQLVDATADFTVAALRATGIPVFREGSQFIIPSGAWSVVEACSGIRYLMASVMVGTLFAYLNFRTNRKRWAFIGVAIVTPVVANWLRAYMIVMLGHLSGNKLAVGVDHLIYGWVFFGIIMLLMFMMGARWADADETPIQGVRLASTARADTRPWMATLAAVCVLLAAPVGVRAQLEKAKEGAVPQLALPALPGWTWVPEPLTTWSPGFNNPVAHLHGHFTAASGAGSIGVYIGYYRDQGENQKLVSSINELAHASEKIWSITMSGVTQVDGLAWRTTELRGTTLNEVVVDGSRTPRLRAWHLYWINGKPLISDWQAKLHGAWETLLGHGDDAAVVILYATNADAGPDDARLKDFVHQNWSALDTALRGVRDRDVARKQ